MLARLACWYGSGFVDSPTASGAPYDPERLSCLVNDRGPYVGTRILDLSRADSRALGFDGVQQVVIEGLAPG